MNTVPTSRAATRKTQQICTDPHADLRLYEVVQGTDVYHVRAADRRAVYVVAAQRQLLRPETCSWPPQFRELVGGEQ